MNIITQTFSGRIVSRPDTTWEKNNDDFFPPDFVNRISFSPVVFCRICKAGKCVGERFASRYLDAVGFGVFLFPEDLDDHSEEGYAQASCLDHTSYLPLPLLPLETLGLDTEAEEGFKLFVNAEEAYSSASPGQGLLEAAIVKATRLAYLRRGDYVAVELAGRKPLATRPGLASGADSTPGTTSVSGSFRGRTILDFKILF